MTQTIKNLTTTEKIKPAIFKMAVFAIAVTAVLYVCFLGVAVSKTMEGEKALKAISILEREKIELEEKYIEAVEKLDLDFARANGFVEKAASMAYVSGQDFFASR